MAKNTSSSAFRKINVDQYNEDGFKDDEHVESSTADPSQMHETEVTSLLNKANHAEALKLLLQNAPLGSKDSQLKDKTTKLVMKVLMTVKVPVQIESVVSTLDVDCVDTLMKYIYRGFEMPSEYSSALLLTWHEKTFAKGGLGCIVRVMTDTKRVY